jgi:hypothetical protein
MLLMYQGFKPIGQQIANMIDKASAITAQTKEEK